MKKILSVIILLSLLGCVEVPKNKDIKDTMATDTLKIKSVVPQQAKLDSLRIKELKKQFNFRKDEFDADGTIWVEPKSSPKYTNQNGFYAYFQLTDGIPSNMRIKYQYHSDEWLFIRKLQFSIDGKAMEYIPNDVKTDSGDGYIWEWFDDSVDYTSKPIIEALIKAKKAKVKLIGTQYYDIKSITALQLSTIKKTLELYTLMGGKL
jgi:hypothetical protein